MRHELIQLREDLHLQSKLDQISRIKLKFKKLKIIINLFYSKITFKFLW